MLVLIISFIVAAVGVALVVWQLNGWDCPEWVAYIGIVMAGIGAAIFLIVGAISLGVASHLNTDYEAALCEREILSAALENSQSEQITDISYLYSKVIDFNNKLRRQKRWAGNIWVGSMYNSKIATLDYIEIPRVDVP